MERDGSSVTTCVTIVHGTFAHGVMKSYSKCDFQELVPVDWARDKEPLCESLRAKFGDRLEIRHFGWSGRNTHAARLGAAKDLREHLLEAASLYENAKHYLVCHSHGGNVALMALRTVPSEDGPSEWSVIRGKIEGIACLATPFLIQKRRNLDLSGFGRSFAFLNMVAIPAGVCCLLVVVARVVSLIRGSDPSGQPGLEVWLPLLAICAAVVIGFRWFLQTDLLWLKRTLRRHWVFKLPDPGMRLRSDLDEPLLAIRSTGDEATGGLVLGQVVAWASERAWAMLVQVSRFLRRGAGLIAGVFVAIPTIYLAKRNDWTLLVPNSFSGYVWAIFASVFLVLGLIVAIQGLLALVIVTSSMLRFGSSHCLLGLLLRITAESTPPGRWPILLITDNDPPREQPAGRFAADHDAAGEERVATAEAGTEPRGSSASTGFFRAHTRVTRDPRALQALVDWMAGNGASRVAS